MQTFYIVLGLITAYVLIVLLVNYIVGKLQLWRHAKEEHMMISVRVSKENEYGPIVAEQIFSTLHGIYEKHSIWKRLLGYRNKRVSFEIANINSVIRFYVYFPKTLKGLIEGQIYAQYPDVEIEHVEDFSHPMRIELQKRVDGKALVPHGEKPSDKRKSEIIDPLRGAVGAELKFISPDVFPIKRFIQFEDKLTRIAVDPLSGITATISKLNTDEDQAWIQVVASPLADKWRVVYLRCLNIMNAGFLGTFEAISSRYMNMFCQRKVVYKWLFPWLYFFLWLQSIRKRGKAEAKGDNQPVMPQEDDPEQEINMRHERESPIQGAIDKVMRLMFETHIRIVYVPKSGNKAEAEAKLKEIAGSFRQFHFPHINGFSIGEMGTEVVQRYQERALNTTMVMSAEELATIYHMPSMTVMTPRIYWVRSKKLEPPSDLPTEKKLKDGESLTMLGKTNFRGDDQLFGIKGIDRRRHMYIIGKTGMGKSTLLENMLYSDVVEGRGIAVIDPHGDLADAVLDFVPGNRTNDVIVCDPSDRDFPIAFNMLEVHDPAMNSIVSSGLVAIFKKIYADSWGPRLEHILRNTILSLLEYPGSTMLGITRVLQDGLFRSRVIRKVTDPVVRSFWENEFLKMNDRQRTEAISPILNKVGQFLSSPIVRNIVGQPKSTINVRFAMDRKKIIVVNLSKGKIGEDNSSLLGAMMITKFQIDAMSRANISADKRVDFYLYVDEFQNFATDSFATILSEARKYKLNLTMANQYIAQMPEEVRDAVFGNVGTLLSFQVGYDDAEYLSQQYAEEVTPNDLVSLSKYTAYTRLLVDGMPTKTFSLGTLPPPAFTLEEGRRDKVMKVSRERYSKKRDIVEDKIQRWSLNTTDTKKLDGKDDKKKDDKKSEPKKTDKKRPAPKKAAPKAAQPKTPQKSKPNPKTHVKKPNTAKGNK